MHGLERRDGGGTVIADIERRQLREIPQFKAGGTVRVHFKEIG